MPPASSTAGTQRVGPISMDAVIVIANSMSSMNGVVSAARNISRIETPARTPSVGGNFSRSSMWP